MDPQSSQLNFAPKIFINDRELVDDESFDDTDIYRGDRSTTPTMDPQSSQLNSPPKIFINDRELVDDESVDDTDIYRGDRSITPQTQESGSATSLKSISAASSASSRLPDGRLGALATGLERAISRWARKNWADSSSSITSGGTSDTSHSSFRTTNRSSRRRRPPSVADIQRREESERAVAARIRAREIGRVVPREFNLYVPPPSPLQDAGPIEEEQRGVRTFALDVMLQHLDPLLRSSGKHRRSRHQHHLHPRQAYSAEDEPRDASHDDDDAPRGPSLTAEKGKNKIPSTTPPLDALQAPSTSRGDPVAGKPRQAWWLDVASPTWGDMKTLGRLLHLHPLTLEDIVQRETREKLESFPKLDYYFIILRVVEYSTPHDRLEIVSQRTGSSQLPVQGVANETCIYLVVLRDGICTFHFSNVSKHLDRVRGKLQTTAQTTRRSSAWIVHEILDSVVDSFFPLVKEIEEHAIAIESVVHNEDNPASTTTSMPPANTRTSQILPAGGTIPQTNALTPRALPAEKVVTAFSAIDEKHAFSKSVASIKTATTHFSLPRLTCGLILRRWGRAITRFFGFCMRKKPRQVESGSARRACFDLHLMTRTRHLATSVARVLATKPEVVAGIRKRLLASDGPDTSDDAEVAIYIGDVQDHILTLQQSLAHYERMLSESHPMYIQNLHFDLLNSGAGNKMSMFMLEAVGVMLLAPTLFTDIMSVNVTLPTNVHAPNGKLWIFGGCIAAILGILSSTMGLVRYWWVKGRRGVKLE